MRVIYAWWMMLGLALAYLQDLCCPALGTTGLCSLRSMERGGLQFVPFPMLPLGRPMHSR